jgi:hypothetical protein
MSLLKYKKFTHGIRTLATCVRVEDFAAGPSELDYDKLHYAVLHKIPGKGTNLGNSELN